ncbi:unnamed protein product, partial [Mesorhabditis spiculigera]
MWIWLFLHFTGSWATLYGENCTCGGQVIDQHCYEIHMLTTPGWVAADDACTAVGGHMAIFLNESQTQSVLSYLQGRISEPILIGIVVANVETALLAGVCPGNQYYGLIPDVIGENFLEGNYSNGDRCSYVEPSDYKIGFGDCNASTIVLCDRPMVSKDYCSSLVSCDEPTDTSFWTTTESSNATSTDWTIDQDNSTETTSNATTVTTPTTANSTTSTTTNTTTASAGTQTTAKTSGAGAQTTHSPGSSTEASDSCRSGGVEIFGWCIPWWILAIIGALLLLLLLCMCCWCCFGCRTNNMQQQVAAVETIPRQVSTVTKSLQTDFIQEPHHPIHSSEPQIIERGTAHIPVDTDNKATMTDFDPEVRTVVEERIKEVEKIIYEPAGAPVSLPPQPMINSDPIDIPINIDIRTRRYDEIHRTEYVDQIKRQIKEPPPVYESEPEPPLPPPPPIMLKPELVDSSASPIPDLEVMPNVVPLAIKRPRSPFKFQHNNKIPMDMGVFDSDNEEEPQAAAHRFVPNKKPSPKKSSKRRRNRIEDEPILGKEEAPPHRFQPKKRNDALTVPARTPMDGPKDPSSRPQPRPKFQPDPEILKIGTPMSRPRSNPEDGARRIARGDGDGISQRRTPGSKAFRDDDDLPGMSRPTPIRRNPASSDNLRKISPVENAFASIPRSQSNPRLRNPDGKLGGVVGPEAKGWKPWAKQPKAFSDKPVFLDYD